MSDDGNHLLYKASFLIAYFDNVNKLSGLELKISSIWWSLYDCNLKINHTHQIWSQYLQKTIIWYLNQQNQLKSHWDMFIFDLVAILECKLPEFYFKSSENYFFKTLIELYFMHLNYENRVFQKLNHNPKNCISVTRDASPQHSERILYFQKE